MYSKATHTSMLKGISSQLSYSLHGYKIGQQHYMYEKNYSVTAHSAITDHTCSWWTFLKFKISTLNTDLGNKSIKSVNILIAHKYITSKKLRQYNWKLKKDVTTHCCLLSQCAHVSVTAIWLWITDVFVKSDAARYISSFKQTVAWWQSSLKRLPTTSTLHRICRQFYLEFHFYKTRIILRTLHVCFSVTTKNTSLFTLKVSVE